MAKIKLGIFGDSYAARNDKNPAKHWSSYLTDEYEVDNWGVRGSSLFYSLTRLQQFHHKYDKIIFVVTSPGRLWLTDLFDPKSADFPSAFVVCYENAKQNEISFARKNLENSLAINTFKAAADYYKYLQDSVFDEFVHNLMIPEIKKTRSDALVIAGSGANNQDVIGHKGSIEDISKMEDRHWGVKNNHLMMLDSQLDDIRHSHLTNINNKLLGEKMLIWLDRGAVGDIDPNDFSPPDFPKEKYHMTREQQTC